MAGTDLPAALPEWARAWNVVDVALAILLGANALGGFRRGFIASTLGLLGLFAAFFVATQTYGLAAAQIQARFPLPAAIANAIGFFVMLIVAQIATVLLIRLVLVALAPVRLLLGPLMIVEKVAGIIPGLIQGTLVAALVLVPLDLLGNALPFASQIHSSVVATQITRVAATIAPPLRTFVEQALGDVALFRSRVIEGETTLQIPAHQEMRLDPTAEAQMLELLNQERTSRGLRPLVMDTALQAVARQHSEEMLQMGYFSHTSPVLGPPADRIARTGLRFRLTGENLAYAPTVQLAHSGLMASPGHRENILTPDYTRIGIGAQNAGLFGVMFTQNFAG